MIKLFKKSNKVVVETEKEFIMKEIKRIRQELDLKYNTFNFIDNDLIDVVIGEINTLLQKHDILLRQFKDLRAS